MSTNYADLEFKIRKLRSELIAAHEEIQNLEDEIVELKERLARELEYCETNHIQKT